MIHLFEDRLRLALHRDHPLASREELRLEDLADETWIDVPAATSGGHVAARAAARAGFVPRVAFESDDYTAIRELVGTGAGVALLPDLALFPPHESVVLRSLEPRPSVPQHPGRHATRGVPLTRGLGDARDPPRSSARPARLRSPPRRPRAGSAGAKPGSASAGRSARKGSIGNAVAPSIASSREDPPEQRRRTSPRARRRCRPTIARMARHEVDHEVAVRRHVVQAAARVELRAGVARQDARPRSARPARTRPRSGRQLALLRRSPPGPPRSCAAFVATSP